MHYIFVFLTLSSVQNWKCGGQSSGKVRRITQSVSSSCFWLYLSSDKYHGSGCLGRAVVVQLTKEQDRTFITEFLWLRHWTPSCAGGIRYTSLYPISLRCVLILFFFIYAWNYQVFCYLQICRLRCYLPSAFICFVGLTFMLFYAVFFKMFYPSFCDLGKGMTCKAIRVCEYVSFDCLLSHQWWKQRKV